MDKLFDKLIIFIICVLFDAQNFSDPYFIVPVILSLILSAGSTYFDNDRATLGVFLAYLLLCLYHPMFIYFIPLFCYDILLTRRQWIVLLAVPVAAVDFGKLPIYGILITFPFIAAAGLMKYRTASLVKLRSDYTRLRDTAKEFSLRLESINKELMEKQDYEINLATLNERNRIAREIHDNVGHTLSSSLLQVGALMAVCKDPGLKEGLTVLKDTLSRSMDSIRSSVHNLHDDSIDLHSEVNSLVKAFTLCPVTLDYDIEGNPGKKYKYAFITIIKEALSNVMRHSNAGAVSIVLREHPAIYQLAIRDNGTQKPRIGGEGLGLSNMEDRVKSLNGIININRENGFNIFISVPKEGENADSDR